ncbi:N-acetyltransferase [Pannus brasiliensis CCIBt3594]|uniref:N-acetyltransferase n=2 Tax=Pannus TaxID=1427526 RepID=A0AAW9QU54_9CHRO
MGVDSCFLSYLFSDLSDLSSSSDGSDAAPLPVEIRFARARDLRGIAEILTDSFFPSYYLWTWTRPLFKLGIYEDLRGRLNANSPHYRCIVAAQTLSTESGPRESIIATAEIGLKASSLLSTHIPYISNLAVAPDRRRCGIARKILLQCERIATEWGFDELSLHVLDNNTAARELYFSSGYRLQKVDGWLGNRLFNRPQRLFLHKKLER